MTDLDAPFQLATMAPRRRRRWLIPLLVALAAVLVAVGAAYALTGDERAPAAAEPSAVATSASLLSEKEACQQIRPLVDQAGQYEADMKTSGQPAGGMELGRLRQAIAEVYNIAPEPIKTDIGYLRTGVVTMISAQLPDQNFHTAQIRIVTRCASY